MSSRAAAASSPRWRANSRHRGCRACDSISTAPAIPPAAATKSTSHRCSATSTWQSRPCARTPGVERVVLLAWRGGGAALHSLVATGRHRRTWSCCGSRSSMALRWLRELQAQMTRERALRPRPRPGVPRTDRQRRWPVDGICRVAAPAPGPGKGPAGAGRSARNRHPTWAVVRADVAAVAGRGGAAVCRCRQARPHSTVASRWKRRCS